MRGLLGAAGPAGARRSRGAGASGAWGFLALLCARHPGHSEFPAPRPARAACSGWPVPLSPGGVTQWSLQRTHGGRARGESACRAAGFPPASDHGTRGVARGCPCFVHTTAGSQGLSHPSPLTCLRPAPSFPSLLKGTHVSLGCLIPRVLRQDRGGQGSSLVLPRSL